MPKIELFVEPEGWSVSSHGAFVRWLEGELLCEGRGGLIYLIFVDNDRITELNETHLGHEGPTDVISFNLESEGEEEDGDFVEPEESSGANAFPSGEVYVSLNRATEQAVQYGVNLADEVSRLALHGMLHLAGWEDSDEAERGKMSLREDEGLARGRGEGEFPWSISPPNEEA